MLIDPNSTFFRAAQTVASSISAETFVASIASNITVAQSALSFAATVRPARAEREGRGEPVRVSGYGDPPSIDFPIEAVKKFVIGAADFVKTSFDHAFPDMKMDGKVERFNSEERVDKPTSEVNTYVINGVHQDEDSRAAQATMAAETLGKDVNLVHNATGGFPLDAVEYLKETFLGIPSRPSEKLSDELYRKIKAGENVEIVAYSQGSTQTTQALSLTIARMKKDGMTDEEIRSVMQKQVKVTMVGTPVDPGNPLQLIWNVPPGLPGVGQKRLDWYFQEQDIVLHGGNPPSSETVTTEPGGQPNFTMIRHEKDPVATWVRSVGPADAVIIGGPLAVAGPLALLNPITSAYIGVRLVDIGVKLGVNQSDEGAVFGYHDYALYNDYMRNGISGDENP